MALFKENQFINQYTVDKYMSKYNPPNAPLWFNLKEWMKSFITQWDKKQAVGLLNPLYLKLPVLGFNWEVHAYINSKNTQGYSHSDGEKTINSMVHSQGYAIDFASDNHVATYSFFRYLRELQLKGAKFRIMISKHNHHIHIDNHPSYYGQCLVECNKNDTTGGGFHHTKPYDQSMDNDIRKWYNVPVDPDQEEPNAFNKYFELYSGYALGFGFILIFILLLFSKKGVKK